MNALTLVILVVLALGAGRGDAQVPGGSAQLAGRSVLRVKGCGKDRADFAAAVSLEADGTWSAADVDGALFAGTWTAIGSSGRKFDLQLDAASASSFLATLVADVSELCQATATLSSAVRKVFVLRLNHPRTTAKVKLVYKLAGSAGGRSGTARYQVSGKGPWTPG